MLYNSAIYLKVHVFFVMVFLLALAGCQQLARPVAPAAVSTPSGEASGTAPATDLPTAQRKQLALSSLRGKYVVIVFWKSGNAASRAESPNLRKIYQQFQSRGLEIYGVSLDTSRREWRRAIREDALSWPQVMERKGRKSSLALAYGVQVLPYTVLLDPQGHVLARDLYGRALGQKISEYIPLD
jgi:peroxiredoxin